MVEFREGPCADGGLDAVVVVRGQEPSRRRCRHASVPVAPGCTIADTERAAEVVERVRRHTDQPALVGFGASGLESAAKLAAVSDGVIVGSPLPRAVRDLRGEPAAAAAGAFLDGSEVVSVYQNDRHIDRVIPKVHRLRGPVADGSTNPPS